MEPVVSSPRNVSKEEARLETELIDAVDTICCFCWWKQTVLNVIKILARHQQVNDTNRFVTNVRIK